VIFECRFRNGESNTDRCTRDSDIGPCVLEHTNLVVHSTEKGCSTPVYDI